MALNFSKAIASAASAGLMLGAITACSGSKQSKRAAQPSSSQSAREVADAKDCCKGMNACAGKGGCAAAGHDCAGKNACKGQGGCNGHCPK